MPKRRLCESEQIKLHKKNRPQRTRAATRLCALPYGQGMRTFLFLLLSAVCTVHRAK